MGPRIISVAARNNKMAAVDRIMGCIFFTNMESPLSFRNLGTMWGVNILIKGHSSPHNNEMCDACGVNVLPEKQTNQLSLM